MQKFRITLKIICFTVCYALFYYWLPLPQIALIGFFLPLAYLYPDMHQVKYIQVQYVIGFGLGILLSYEMMQIGAWNVSVAFAIMTSIVLLTSYLSCFQTLLRLPYVIVTAMTAISFNLIMSEQELLSLIIVERLILGVVISVVLYGVIDMVLGDSHYNYIPTKIFKNVTITKTWYWSYFNHSLCIYICLLCILGLQKLIVSSVAICAVASASVIIVLAGDSKITRTNIILRISGAFLGVVLGMLQLVILAALPFFFMQIAMLTIFFAFASYFILRFPYAIKVLPQAAITYITIVAIESHISTDIQSAWARLLGIVMGTMIVYVVSTFFCEPHEAQAKKIGRMSNSQALDSVDKN